MAYNTEDFEKATQAKGYIIESVKKQDLNTVESMKGSIVVGSHVRQVWWDKDGQCFSYKRVRLPKYDLF